ncbi:MAG TPA: hypothetical protein DER11_04765 [Janibacter terrae]|nr:hypothetical protein [Janibacter terrae]
MLLGLVLGDVVAAVRARSREAEVSLLRLALGRGEVELPLGSAAPDVGLEEPEPVAEGCGWRSSGLPMSVARTGRNCICEDAAMASSCSLVGVPGIATTMLESPCVVTSAPVVPCESMRCTMMSRASASCSWETDPPPPTRGSRTIWVPPARSSPRRGAQLASFCRTP